MKIKPIHPLLFLLFFSSQASIAAPVTTTGCISSTECTLNEMFAGASIQIDDILLSNWGLTYSRSVNLDDVGIGEGYGGTVNEAGLLSTRNHALMASGSERIDLDFSFMASSITGVITGIDELFGFGRYDTTWGYVQGSVTIGTAQGLSDLGSATTRRSPNSGNYHGNPISVPDLNSIWVNTSIDIYGGYSGEYAEMGWNSVYGHGPGYRYAFSVGEAPEQTVPEPSILLLLSTGGFLAFFAIRAKSAKISL